AGESARHRVTGAHAGQPGRRRSVAARLRRVRAALVRQRRRAAGDHAGDGLPHPGRHHSGRLDRRDRARRAHGALRAAAERRFAARGARPAACRAGVAGETGASRVRTSAVAVRGGIYDRQDGAHLPRGRRGIRMNIPFADGLLYHYVARQARVRPVPPVSEWRLHEARRVLLALTTGLGDAVLSTPVFPALRNALPTAEIRLLCRAPWVPLFAADPDLNGVISYRGKYRGFFTLAAELRRFLPDTAVILHGHDPAIL